MFSTVFYIVYIFCLFTYVFGSYDCVCNYAVETPVNEAPDVNSQVIGYMYEFDCKPKSKLASPGWEVIEFEHKIGYVMVDEELQVQICTGDVPSEDRITTKTVTSTEHQPSTTSVQRSTTKLLSKPPTEVVTKYTTSSLPSSSSMSVVSTSTTSSTLPLTTTHVKTDAITVPTSHSTILNALISSSSPHDNNVTQSLLSTDNIPVISRSPNTTMTPFISSTAKISIPTTVSSLSGSSSSADRASNISTMYSHTITMTSSLRPNKTMSSKSSILAVLTHSTLALSNASKTSATTPTSDTSSSAKYTTTIMPYSSSTLQPFTTTADKTKRSSSRLTRTSTILETTTPLPTTTSEYSIHMSSTSSTRVSTRSSTSPTASAPVMDRVDLCPYQYLADDFNQGKPNYPHFRQFGDYCYEIRQEQKTWSSAHNDCDTRGGKLAVIKNNEVEKRIQSLASTSRAGGTVWMGLRTQNGRYEWIDGSMLANITLADKMLNKPGSVTDIDCVVLDASGSWRNVACEETHSWICQYSVT